MTAIEQPEDGEEQYSLVMPFVCVESNGGQYDDEAFVAGWQMGALDRDLATLGIHLAVLPLYTSCAEQVDLIAMKHGFTVTVLGGMDDTWSTYRFERTAAVG